MGNIRSFFEKKEPKKLMVDFFHVKFQEVWNPCYKGSKNNYESDFRIFVGAFDTAV